MSGQSGLPAARTYSWVSGPRGMARKSVRQMLEGRPDGASRPSCVCQETPYFVQAAANSAVQMSEAFWKPSETTFLTVSA
ncbi:hypothetical protein GCM10009826_21410 [Humibacillus xanthopallidus]